MENTVIAHRSVYGTQETAGLSNGPAYHAARFAQGQIRLVPWTAPGLRVTRLRLLSDPGYSRWDVSYCHGMIGAEHVDVELPFSDLPKSGFRREIVQAAIHDGIHAKRLGVLDAISTLN